MKNRIWFIKLMMLIVVTSSDGQIAPQSYSFPRDTSRYTISSLSNELVRLKDKRSGATKLLNVSEYGKYSVSDVPSLIIDMSTIDTSVYASLYNFWKEVPVGNILNYPVVASDQNHNGSTEITCQYFQFGDDIFTIPSRIYEMGANNNYSLQYTYQNISVFSPFAAKDKPKDLPSQLFFITRGGLNTGIESYISPDNKSLCTRFNYHYTPGDSAAGQFNTPTFFYIKDNDNLEMVYFFLGRMSGDTTGSTGFSNSYHIAEFDSAINNFKLKYYWRPSRSARSSWWGGDGYGFATGDFDMDGMKEIATGSIFGDVNIIKCFSPDSFAHIYSGTVETYNAWMACGTDDIDHNGKPEFWIGGDAIYNGIPKTVITSFESSGNNGYESVYKIEIIGIMSFYAEGLFAKDVDQDGTDELIAFLGGTLFIFKNIGQREFKLFYMRGNELANIDAVWTSGTLADVDGDGVPEILISLDILAVDSNGKPDGTGRSRFATYIYRHTFPTAVVGETPISPKVFSLSQNFPNPFNPTTEITYQTSEVSHVTLTVYDILGSAVKTLVNEKQNAGRYSVSFNGGNLSSGIYFYRFTALRLNEGHAGYYTETKKMLLIR